MHHGDGPARVGRRPALGPLAWLVARAANLTFGGGDAITAVLQRELVTRRAWLTREQFGLALSLAKITPGTGVLAFCAAAAYVMRGIPGTLASVLAASVPCAAIAALLTAVYASLDGVRAAAAALAVVLAAAVGMMWAAVWLLVRPQLGRATWLRTAVTVVGPFLALAVWSISPVQVILAAAVVGAAWAPGRAP